MLCALLLCPTSSRGTLLRANAGWGWDDNAREAMLRQEFISDRFFRLAAEGTPDPLRWRRSSAGIRLRGLMEQYDRLATETRYQGDATLDLQQGMFRGITGWGSGWIEGRTYPDSLRRSFVRGSFAGGVRAPFRGGSIGLGGAAREIDYHRTPGVDRRSGAVTLEYRRPLRHSLDGKLSVEFETVRWDRPAIRRTGPDLFDTTGHQRDRGRQFDVGLRYLRGWLFEASVGIESIRSNSFGYSIRRTSLEGGVTGWVPGSVLVQLRGRVESVKYRDPGLDRVYILPAGEDLEAAKDNNILTLRLRRALLRQVALEARSSWFRNESLLVGYHYRKALATIGLVWTPIGASDF